MRQAITLYDFHPYPLHVPSGHRLNAHGHWAWVHRLLWATLDRLGAIMLHFEETISFRRVLIDEAAVINKVRHVLDAIHSRHERPQEILMGPEMFSELMADPNIRGHFAPVSFNVSYHVDRSMFGLPVRVLPWMEGILVR